MIGFTGRHDLKQYLPMKPTKWGFKAFLLCESTTGYCLKHKIFTGSGQEEFKTRNLCNELVEGFENSNYHAFMDNFYSSIPTFLKKSINSAKLVSVKDALFTLEMENSRTRATIAYLAMLICMKSASKNI